MKQESCSGRAVAAFLGKHLSEHHHHVDRCGARTIHTEKWVCLVIFPCVRRTRLQLKSPSHRRNGPDRQSQAGPTQPRCGRSRAASSFNDTAKTHERKTLKACSHPSVKTRGRMALSFRTLTFFPAKESANSVKTYLPMKGDLFIICSWMSNPVDRRSTSSPAGQHGCDRAQ